MKESERKFLIYRAGGRDSQKISDLSYRMLSHIVKFMM